MDQTYLKGPVRAVHLAVDFLPQYMKGLGEKTARELCDGERQFATDIAPEVPIIWIAGDEKGVGPKVYSREMTARPEAMADLIKVHDLAACRPEPGEEIVTKEKTNLFYSSKILAHLKENYPNVDTLIFTGGWADQCVALSVYSAMIYGYDVLGVTDLMFGPPPIPGKVLVANEKLLTDAVARQFEGRTSLPDGAAAQRGKLFIYNRDSAVQWVKEKPAPPRGQAPVSLITQSLA